MVKRLAIELEKLEEGYKGLSKRKASAHGEASFFCLTSHNHETGVEMELHGTFSGSCFISWQYLMTEQIQHTWRENNEATEEGASGIAILLMMNLTEYDDVSRAWHTSGFDYFLGFSDSDEPFDRAAKLEVSGIREAKNDGEIKRRVKDKLAQTSVSDTDGLPMYIVVVEFSKPFSQVVKK